MDDQDTMDLLFEAATGLAQANLPSSVSAVLTTVRLTALSKWDGGVRGVATGCTFHRLVARTLAKQFAEDFEQECSPFQHALSTRTGTDCVGHLLRVATDANFLVLMGLALTTMCCERPCWEDWSACHVPKLFSHLCGFRTFSLVRTVGSMTKDSGRWSPKQRGGEQGDPLTPLLFEIGTQKAVEEVSRFYKPGEHLCAFLDDIYLLCEFDRVKPLYNPTVEPREASHLDKSRWLKPAVQGKHCSRVFCRLLFVFVV